MTPEDLERMLSNIPAPPPPEGLAERIVDEIPEAIELGKQPSRTPWRLAAAAVLTVALTGTVVWELRTRRPSEDLQPTSGVTVADKPTPVAVPTASPHLPVLGHLERADRPAAEGNDVAREGDAEEMLRGVNDEYTRELRHRVLDQAKTLKNQVDRDLHAQQEAAASAAPPNPLTYGPLPTPPHQIAVTSQAPLADTSQVATQPRPTEELYLQIAPMTGSRDSRAGIVGGVTSPTPAPSTGGTAEPNDQPYGDVFFREYGVNPFIDTEDDRLSTFGLEVDTGSYTVVRRYLRDGHLPPREAVRVEELLNSFDYGDEPPQRGDFALRAEAAPSPFGEGPRYVVVRFGIKGRVIEPSKRKPAVLTFVVDVSGSMGRENRLGLVKKALSELLGQLRPDDLVGLVVYGSSGQVLLEPSGDLEAVRSAIGRLSPGGSTNAEEGLVLGYDLARRFRREDGLNRVILCSDGVANVGRTGPDSILGRIRAAAKGEAIELTTVGFGMGNYNDVLMEQLADAGDGRYAYVDTLEEARRLFVEELTGTLQSIARDARVQVDFNPEVVSRYRLLGYENRDIADERFRDNTVDAGEIGAGHAVTALYELKLAPRPSRRATLATLTLRYQVMGDDEWVEQAVSIRADHVARRWDDAPRALRLATLVAEYGEILKGAYWAKEGDMAEVLRRAQVLQADFQGDARVADFAGLAATAAKLLDRQAKR